MKSVEETSVAETVGFLSSRVAEQARSDSVPLTDIELRQLSFTEETATAEEIAGARAFDEANDTDQFEAKITRLLRSAFDQDVQRGMRATWEKHLAALRNHDVYILVMVDEAGIPRPKPTVRLMPARAISPMVLVQRSPDILAGLITVCGVVYFFVLRIGSFADHLIPNEKFRGIFLFAWLASTIWLFVRFKDLRD
jgi:hypothetical protein